MCPKQDTQTGFFVKWRSMLNWRAQDAARLRRCFCRKSVLQSLGVVSATTALILVVLHLLPPNARFVALLIIALSMSAFGWMFASMLCRRLEVRKQHQHQVLHTFFWASLSFIEASHWHECAADQKPSVRYEPHKIKTCATGAFPGAQEAAPGFAREVGREAANGSPSTIEPSDVDLAVSVEDGPKTFKQIAPHAGDTDLSSGSCSTGIGKGFQSKDSLLCPCCLDRLQESQVIALLQCGHLFCEECIKSWAFRSTTCPFCRASMVVI